MLMLDTNTLYYAFGLSNHHLVDSKTIIQEIDKAENVMISSISFAEFILKYRNHAGIVRRVCSSMRQHHVEICVNKYIPLPCGIIKIASTIRQRELNSLHKELIFLKSRVESRFATAVFLVVLFSEAIFECNIDPYNVPQCIYDLFSVVFKDSLCPIITEVFERSYKSAYKTDDAENLIKRDFNEHLKTCISLCIPLCKHVQSEYNKIPEGDVVDVPQIIQEYSDVDWVNEMTSYQKRIDKKKTPAMYVKRKGLAYGKEINDKHLSALLKGLDTSFKKTIEDLSLEEYLYHIVPNTLSKGGAFLKNDINDALILSDLQLSDLILTFDTRMIEHLERNKLSRIEYQSSITLINSLLFS